MTGAVEYILLGDIGAPGPSPTMTVTDKLSLALCRPLLVARGFGPEQMTIAVGLSVLPTTLPTMMLPTMPRGVTDNGPQHPLGSFPLMSGSVGAVI
jgi:hypothetical protein